MYECPNCAGNLRFDITRQQLYCENCDTQVDPYQFHKDKDALETEYVSDEYEVTVFTCPQCGGEIISEDTTAATFCSFCGASTILDSRIGKERRPVHIIPFTRTREDCRAAYGKMLRRAVFAPRELKDEAHIRKFRGIYMPYWVYSFEKNGPVSFLGGTNHREGDYLVTEHYMLDCSVEEEYKGLAYDASSTFSDSLSSAIGPFDLKESKAFVPSFLSGFYADTSDVEAGVYQSDAEELVVGDASSHLARDLVCREYYNKKGEDAYALRNALRPSVRKAELAMLPVWFLSYRNGDRVSYAVVNGQTGKAAADLPVDWRRYLAGSCLLAVPIFCLLNLFFTITPGRLLMLVAVLSGLCVVISNGQLTRILARESGEDDKGLASVRPAGRGDPGWNTKRHIRQSWDTSPGIVVLMVVLFYVTGYAPGLLIRIIDLAAGENGISPRIRDLAVMLLAAFGIHFIFSSLNKRRAGPQKPFGGGHFKEKWPALRKPLGGILGAVIILVINPVSDWYYYIGALVCMGTVFWAVMDIIRQHNRLTMRRLPQMNRRGGDEYGREH